MTPQRARKQLSTVLEGNSNIGFDELLSRLRMCRRFTFVTVRKNNQLGGWRVTVKRAREPSQIVSGAEMETSLRDTEAHLAQHAQRRAFLAVEHKQRFLS
ncbi:hypothetical protein TNIN_169311 [Trichonephila inaurata madagascariensis]|uniref:Uncharacterized protein n=1 Tax=Trichonephila inaurata madagascariensis TaxID=2747483 RepID=A0A8X6JYQ2_9ARAC|nr:hypothetical protein TNIN_169311 [Trichonephila inaurata madagascariensis]